MTCVHIYLGAGSAQRYLCPPVTVSVSLRFHSHTRPHQLSGSNMKKSSCGHGDRSSTQTSAHPGSHSPGFSLQVRVKKGRRSLKKGALLSDPLYVLVWAEAEHSGGLLKTALAGPGSSFCERCSNCCCKSRLFFILHMNVLIRQRSQSSYCISL